MIVIDSARADLLSCYSQELPTSPNVDRIASRGLLFETAISPSAWTFPAMASTFTGMIPSKHGGHDEHEILDSEYPTIAELLQSNGYQTAAFADVPYVGPMTKLDRGFDSLSNMRLEQVSLGSKVQKGMAALKRKLTGAYQKNHESPVLFREAMGWLSRDRRADRPFFLYVHSDQVHAPYLPPPRYRRMFTDITDRQMRAINQDKALYIGGAAKMTGEDFANLWKLYCAETRYLDDWIGRLLAHMQRLGVLDNTLIVIFGDHGDNFGDHGLLRHGLCLYDTLLKVPLIVSLPGKIAPRRVSNMVRLIDLPPTILAAVGIEDEAATAEFQGQNLLEAVEQGSFAGHAVSEIYRPSSKRMFAAKVPDFVPEFEARYDRVLRSYRTDTHKFLWSSNGKHELYDLVKDPGELDNIYQREPALSAKLQAQLEAVLSGLPGGDGAEGAAGEYEVDELVMDRLRDLGYVE